MFSIELFHCGCCHSSSCLDYNLVSQLYLRCGSDFSFQKKRSLNVAFSFYIKILVFFFIELLWSLAN